MKQPIAYDVAHVPANEVSQAQLDNVAKTVSSQEIISDEAGVYVFPASLEQIRYWTLDQLDGASTASNMAIAARLEGKVEDCIVEQSVRALVERHEALRTTFRLVDDRLCQVISEEARYSFAITDLTALPESDREAAAAAAIEEHSHARADLATGPAFFVRLIHLNDQLHYLALTMHHIVCDGWSNGILIRDFTDFYAAFASHTEPALPELPFQFADFTVWQQNWLESDAAQAALAHWRTHIHRGLPAVDLPTDEPRRPQKSSPGHIESTLLPPRLTAQLKNYCRTHNATMHQVLLAAFEALIARYANQSEFLLGSTIANRTQPGMENVVGRFANPQVILADVNGDPSYAEILRRVGEWSAESYAHQDLPFSRLMEEFQMDQAGATSQFLQVYFVYQKAFMQPQEAGGLKVIPRPSVSGGVNFDLLVSIVERAEGPRLQMEYNTILFRKERILSLIGMYQRVLEAVMADDSLTVSRLPLTAVIEPAPRAAGEAQATSGISELTSAAASTMSGVDSLAQLLDRRADSQGNTTAIINANTGHSVTWDDLREQSLTMVSALRRLGVSAGQTVVMRLEHSALEAAAAWALLRIGAVVLPLPASTGAPAWTTFVLEHKPALALASADFAGLAVGVTPYDQLLHQSSGSAAGITSVPYPDAATTAWLGIHSGQENDTILVPATHDATSRQIQGTIRALDLRTGDVVLVYPARAATDAWIDLLLPLVAGATALYANADAAEKMPALLDQHQVSFVLTGVQELLAAVHGRWSGDRRLNIVMHGSLIDSGLARRLAVNPMRLWSLISAAEAAGPMALSKVSGELRPTYLSVGDLSLAVLDDNDQPAPIGVAGELAVNSIAGWTRTGYLARTTTAVSADASAAVEILDPISHQVRLSGYRLRLGELEEILWQSPSVADVAAAIVPHNDGHILVAYFAAYAPSEINTRLALNHFLSVAPGHVASAELVAVDHIARRFDGSLDLVQLPAPDAATQSTAPSDEYLAPRDELESRLVAIWEEVLGVRPIGVRSSFFKLGGYSLMIVRLFARINKALGTTLPITTVFNAPTIEQLAEIVRGKALYSSLVPVQTKGTRPPFFMIHSYLLYQGIPAELGEDVPFYGLRELDSDAPDMTVEQRAAACLKAMRSIQPKGPYYIGAWCAAGPLAVETARQIVANGESVAYLVLFDSWRPGYAAELAREQAGMPEMALRARLYRKYRFHQQRWVTLSFAQRVRYVALAVNNKLSSLLSKFYLKNWAFAEWFCKKFGLPLPHFMHNVSLTTLNSLKEYRGVEAYPGSMTLIRAKQAPYIPGAQEHCGWNSIVKGGVHVLWAPGDHESMFLSPHLQTVGAFLRQGLAEAYAKNAS